MEWISVEDDLPELGRAVWLKDDKRIWIGCRDMVVYDEWHWGNSYNCFWYSHKKGMWVCDNEIDDDYQPTEWMPLPEPPKQ